MGVGVGFFRLGQGRGMQGDRIKLVDLLNRLHIIQQKQTTQTLMEIQKTYDFDWKSMLIDAQAQLDILRFKNWDHNLQFPGRKILLKDIARTRKNQSYFLRKETIVNLQLITTFYCKDYHIQYQQGLLQVVVPFLLLRTNSFRLQDCYAYFSSFMRKFFPSTLRTAVINGKKQLPFVISSLVACQVLIKYHNPSLIMLINQNDIIMASLITPWLMTLFARDTPIHLIYHVFDRFMKINSQSFLIYLAGQLVLSKFQEMKKALQQDRLQHFCYNQLKKFNDTTDIQTLYSNALRLKQKTPQSFNVLLERICLRNDIQLGDDQLEQLINLEFGFVDKTMNIYISDFQKNKSFFNPIFIVENKRISQNHVDLARLKDSLRQINAKAADHKVIICKERDPMIRRKVIRDVVKALEEGGMSRVSILEENKEKSCMMF